MILNISCTCAQNIHTITKRPVSSPEIFIDYKKESGDELDEQR